MPAPLKPPDRRQRQRPRHKETHLRITGDIVIPDPPRRLLKTTRDAWTAYWSSPVAEAAELSTDLPAIERLFRLRDERERAYREFRKNRVVKGSQNQDVLNPLAKYMATVDAEIRQLEDRLGLTPKSRAQLGITIGTARRTLDDLNRGLECDEEDPRIVLADED